MRTRWYKFLINRFNISRKQWCMLMWMNSVCESSFLKNIRIVYLFLQFSSFYGSNATVLKELKSEKRLCNTNVLTILLINIIHYRVYITYLWLEHRLHVHEWQLCWWSLQYPDCFRSVSELYHLTMVQPMARYFSTMVPEIMEPVKIIL